MRTLGKVLEDNAGIGRGFDFLRVFLALSIVAFHSLSVTGQYYDPYSLDDTPFWIVHYALVPMFFALSGFLVTASASRLSLKNFLINRGLRIVPALAVDTFVCALIIGPIFTTTSLGNYFFSREFVTFFLNIVGWVHFTLPGVFTTHAVARVNGSLWTVPFELTCYALISVLIVMRAVRRRFLVLGFTLAYLVAAVAVQASGLVPGIANPMVRSAVSIAFIEHEAQSVTAFLLGIVAYQNRDLVPYSPALFAACAATVIAAAFALPMAIGASPILRFILLPALAYVTVFIGLSPMKLPGFFRTGDYSYGIYLYHQPFLQIVVSLLPALALAPGTGAAFTFCAALPFVLGVAWLSWHGVEKPLLALRKRFTIMAKERGVDHNPPRPVPVDDEDEQANGLEAIP